jgi:hypothetical protein
LLGNHGSAGTALVTTPRLRAVVQPAAYDRLAADPGVSNPLTATDAQVAQYVDFYFEYDGNARVTKEVVEGGARTFTFSVTQSGNANGYNSWKWKTTETRPDGSQRIVYSNYAAQTMLEVLQSGSQQWLTFYQYGQFPQQGLLANPNAVATERPVGLRWWRCGSVSEGVE